MAQPGVEHIVAQGSPQGLVWAQVAQFAKLAGTDPRRKTDWIGTGCGHETVFQQLKYLAGIPAQAQVTLGVGTAGKGRNVSGRDLGVRMQVQRSTVGPPVTRQGSNRMEGQSVGELFASSGKQFLEHPAHGEDRWPRIDPVFAGAHLMHFAADGGG